MMGVTMDRHPSRNPVAATSSHAAANAAPSRNRGADFHDSARMVAQREQLSAAFGPAFQVVQRAVGFEFQTYNDSTKLQIVDGEQPELDVEEEERLFIEDKRKKLPRESDTGEPAPLPDADSGLPQPRSWVTYFEDDDETYARGGGIKVEKDGPDLEFVTHAFEESDSGRSALTQALRNAIITALGLEQRPYTNTPDIAALGADLAPAADARDTVRVKSAGPMKAAAQATVGIRLGALDRLISLLGKANARAHSNDLKALFDAEEARPDQREKALAVDRKVPPTLAEVLGAELGNNKGNDTQVRLMHDQRRAPSMVRDILSGIKGAEPLRGLVHLIVLYVYGGDTTAKYGKGRTPIMSRTNLADAVYSLPVELQILFATKVIPAMTREFPRKKVAMDRALYVPFPTGEKAAMGMTPERSAAITITSWLNGLKPQADGPGKDATEEFDGFAVIANKNRDAPDAGEYQTKWFQGEYGQRMESSTDIGLRETTGEIPAKVKRADGLVVELRNLGNDHLDVSEWASFATSLFDLILLVNAVSQEEEQSLAQAMLEQRSFETDLGDEPMLGVFERARALLRDKAL